MYVFEDSFDELELSPAGGPPTDFIPPATPGQAAIKIGLQVAKYIPGIREVVELPGKLIGQAFGFGKGAKTKYRRMKKKGTRQSGGQWGENDCIQGQPELVCKGAVKGVTKHLREGKCYFKGKPPNEEFKQAYRLVYRPCVNALRDCRGGSSPGKSLWDNFPKKDPYVARRGADYKKRWEKRYNLYYQECPKAEGQATGSYGASPWLLVGLAGIAILALRGRAR